MAGLIVSVSGIRGIVGETLTVEVAMRFARAFGEQLGKGLVLVGTDGRPSGRMLKHAVCAGLNASGCQTMDVGVVPTPTMGVGITALKAVGGIQITASHNSAPYNGMKLFGSDGRVVPATVGEVVKKRYESNSFRHGKWDEAPEEASNADLVEKHVQKILAVTDVEAIAKSGWRVFVDANGGAGGPIATKLLNALGVEAILIGEKADGNFTHEPEPIATNLASIGPMVKKANANIRFSVDSGFSTGFGGCNGFYIPSKFEQGVIHFGIGQSTLLSCSNEEIEKKVMDALKGKAAFYYRNNMLFVVCENLMTLHFRPAKRIDSLVMSLYKPAVQSRGNTFANLGNGTFYITLDDVQQSAKKDFTFNSRALTATEKQTYQCILNNIDLDDPLKTIYIFKKLNAATQTFNADLINKDGSKKRIQIKNVL